MDAETCRAALVSYTACDVLSYKDGTCYLHKSKLRGFYTATSVGNWFQAKPGAAI